MSFSFELDRQQKGLVVRFIGELDHHASTNVRESLENELKNNPPEKVVLNLERLSFMDSSGLGVILGRYKTITSTGGKLVLCSVKPSIHKLIEMSGLFKMLASFESEDDALEACEVSR